MNTEKPHCEIKKKLLEQLMFNLYEEPKTIYREYVQNAFDSINEAVRKGIISREDALVSIKIDKSSQRITINDNGLGIRSNEAFKTLLDVSGSKKDGKAQAGMFGIGRLVGGGYCNKLTFKTCAPGETTGSVVAFDAEKIWQMVNEEEDDYLASTVIDECTICEHFDCKNDEHFFEVIMEGVRTDKADDLLNEKQVKEYLQQVAPVDFSDAFKNKVIFKSQDDPCDIKNKLENLETVQISINDGSCEINKAYGTRVDTDGDEISKLEGFTLEDETLGVLGWGWFSLTKYSNQLKDDKKGIRLRKHNIQVGGEDVLSGLWSEKRGNSYFYGEFHVTHPNVTLNSDRNGLAPSRATQELKRRLTDFFKRLKLLYTYANNLKCAIKNANKHINNGVPAQTDVAKADFKKCDSEFETLKLRGDKLKSDYKFCALADVVALYEQDYNEVKSKYKDVLNPPAQNSVATSDKEKTETQDNQPTNNKSKIKRGKDEGSTKTTEAQESEDSVTNEPKDEEEAAKDTTSIKEKSTHKNSTEEKGAEEKEEKPYEHENETDAVKQVEEPSVEQTTSIPPSCFLDQFLETTEEILNYLNIKDRNLIMELLKKKINEQLENGL